MPNDHPDLFRGGNTKSARFENVRMNRPDGKNDVQTDGDYVLPNTGGVSAFSKPQDTLKNQWKLPASAPLGEDLKAVNDKGAHWTIQPKGKMPVEQYTGALGGLNSYATKYSPQTSSTSQPTPNNYAGSYATSPPAPTPARNSQTTTSKKPNGQSFGVQPDPRSRSNKQK